MPDNITTKFKVDISDLKRGINEANNQIKLANAQFKAATAGMDDWSKSAEGIQAKLKQLDSVLQAQKDKVSALREQLERQQNAYKTNGERAEELRAKMQTLADQGVDKTSKEYKLLEQQLAAVEKEQESNGKAVNDLNVKLLEQEAAVGKTQKEMRDYQTALDNVDSAQTDDEKSAEELTDATKKAGDAAEKSSGGFTVLKGALAKLAADGIEAAARGLKNLASSMVESIKDVAAYGDEIEDNSKKLGLSYEAYQKWDYVMKLSGTEITAMSGGMKKLINTIDDARNGTKSAQETFGKLGISMQDVKNLSSEEIFQQVILSLQNVEDATTQAALANDIFSKSGQELLPLLQMNGDEMMNLMQQAEDYGIIMSNDAVDASASFADAMTLAQSTLTGLKNNIISEFLPAATELLQGFAGMAAGVEGAEDQIAVGATNFIAQFAGMVPNLLTIVQQLANAIMTVAPTIINTLLPQIVSMLPQLISTFNSILPELLNSVVKNVLSALPTLIRTVSQLVVGVVKALGKVLPTIIQQVLEIFPELSQAILDSLPEILSAIFSLLQELVASLPVLMPILIEFVKQLIQQVGQFLLENYPILFSAAMELFTSLVSAMPVIIDMLAKEIPNIIKLLIQFFKDNGPTILANAKTMFMELVKAVPLILSSLGSALGSILGLIGDLLITPAKNLFSGLWEKIKGIFSGIGSWFGEKFGAAWQAIKDKFSNFTSFFSGLWDKVKTTFSSLGTKIGDAISGAVKSGINGVISQIERIINNAIGLINGAIDLINKIPSVSISKIQTVNLPRLAKGGVLEIGQIGLLEGSGAEAVVPLENNKRWISAVAADMREEFARNSEYNFTQNIYSPKPLSRIEIYRQTRNQLNFARMKAGV